MIKTKYMFSEAKAKAKDLAPKTKAKDMTICPWGASRPRPWPRGLHLWILGQYCCYWGIFFHCDTQYDTAQTAVGAD